MGTGHFGTTDNDDGAIGFTNSNKNSGLFGKNDSTDAANAPGGSGVFGLTVAPNAAGVFGANNSPNSPNNTGRGVQGNGPQAGVGGFSETGFGVIGQSKSNSGVIGTSETGRGVQGNGTDAGVGGFSDNRSGVIGQSNQGSGMVATSLNGQGLSAFSDNDIAIFARGAAFSGVFEGALVVNRGPNPKDTTKLPSDINGSIVINDGNLFVNKGDVILAGADCAEDFDIVCMEQTEPGTVMVIDSEGALRPSDQSYDKRVAGVISGAGSYKPALILDKQESSTNRMPIALMGKVYCKVDAQYGAIEVGDLLTTSPTSGYAMKASDPSQAFGAVIGKALRPLRKGQALIPVLVSLQ